MTQELVILPNDLVDTSTQTPGGKIYKTKKYNSDDIVNKQTRFFKIAILLTKSGAFNDDLQIKKPDGSFNINSNIVKLIQLSQARVKINSGLEDFIYQLKSANVSPDLVANEVMKAKLQNEVNKNSNTSLNVVSTQTDEPMDQRPVLRNKKTQIKFKSFPLWSEMVYTVKNVLHKYSKPQYILEFDGEKLPRRYFSEELQKVSITDNTLWRIEKILAFRTNNGQREAKIKWLGYSSRYNSWIPVAHLHTL